MVFMSQLNTIIFNIITKQLMYTTSANYILLWTELILFKLLLQDAEADS